MRLALILILLLNSCATVEPSHKRGNYSKPAQFCALKKGRDKTNCYEKVARVHEKNSNYDKAAIAYQKAVNFIKANECYLILAKMAEDKGNMFLAVSYYERGGANSKLKVIYNKKAQSLLAKGNYNRAIIFLSRAFKGKELLKAYKNAAENLLKKQLFSGAIIYFKLSKTPPMVGYMKVGDFLFEKLKFTAATKYYLKAGLSLKYINNKIGMFLLKRGNYDRAIHHLHKAKVPSRKYYEQIISHALSKQRLDLVGKYLRLAKIGKIAYYLKMAQLYEEYGQPMQSANLYILGRNKPKAESIYIKILQGQNKKIHIPALLLLVKMGNKKIVDKLKKLSEKWDPTLQRAIQFLNKKFKKGKYKIALVKHDWSGRLSKRGFVIVANILHPKLRIHRRVERALGYKRIKVVSYKFKKIEVKEGTPSQFRKDQASINKLYNLRKYDVIIETYKEFIEKPNNLTTKNTNRIEITISTVCVIHFPFIGSKKYFYSTVNHRQTTIKSKRRERLRAQYKSEDLWVKRVKKMDKDIYNYLKYNLK
jgi:tetratricopeptide (TPR) repeat protein